MTTKRDKKYWRNYYKNNRDRILNNRRLQRMNKEVNTDFIVYDSYANYDSNEDTIELIRGLVLIVGGLLIGIIIGVAI